MESNKYMINKIRQDITEHNLEIKAVIQDINACIGPLNELHDLNSAGRAKINTIRKLIDRLSDIAREYKDKDLLKDVVLQREQLSGSMEAFRKANIKSMLSIEKANKDDLLKTNSTDDSNGEDVTLRQRGAKRRDKAGLVQMSTNITEQMRSISRQLANTTEQSAQTLDSLVSSSNNVQGTQDELLVTAGTINQSGKLLAKYGRREFTDKILMFFAFAFFIACVLYIVEKRLF